MTNYVYIAASLDGFIADSEGGIEWLNQIPNPEGSDFGWEEFIAKIDAILMGRKTFEKLLEFDTWLYPIPVFVYSRSLKEIPEWLTGKAEIVSGTPEEICEALGKRGYGNLYIDGGVTVQSFLSADLIDELIITRIPILLGQGIPLFGELQDQLRFAHQETVVFPNGLVNSHYLRAR